MTSNDLMVASFGEGLFLHGDGNNEAGNERDEQEYLLHRIVVVIGVCCFHVAYLFAGTKMNQRTAAAKNIAPVNPKFKTG